MKTGNLRLTEVDRRHLTITAAVLGIELSPAAVSNLVRFADVLDLWNRKMNLVSCGSSYELVERHLLDSLAVNALVPDTGTIVDLGSGAGFPGIPLSIIRPQQTVVLVESRQKRASFLGEVKRTLSLANVEIVAGRAETPPSEFSGGGSLVVSRAVWADESLLRVADRWLSATGLILRMRSDDQGVLRTEHGPFVVHSSEGYQIGGGRPRVIDVIGRRADTNVSRETTPS